MSSTTNRNYKVIYDPELDPNPIKRNNNLILQYEEIIDGRAKDPRLLRNDLKSHLHNTSFNIVSYPEDFSSSLSNNIVLVSNIAPLSTESQIITVLSVYGKVNRVEIVKNSQTGGPTGYAKVIFDTQESAANAIRSGNGRRVAISDFIKIELDPTGEKLRTALSPVEKNSDNSGQEDGELLSSGGSSLNQQYHRHEGDKDTSNEKIHIPATAPDYNRPLIDSTVTVDLAGRKKPSRWDRPVVSDFIQRGQSDRSRTYHPEKRYTPPLDPKNTVNATISRNCLPFVRGAAEELEKVFHSFGAIDIYHDAYEWFIVFDSKTAAMRAQKFISEKSQSILGYFIELSIPSYPLEFDESSTMKNQSSSSTLSPLKATKNEHIDNFSSTKQLLFAELVDIFLKDIKSRIIGPYIYDFLNNSIPIKKQDISEGPISEQQPITTAAILESTIVANAIQQGYELSEDLSQQESNLSIYKLPRFKKRTTSQRSLENICIKESSSPPKITQSPQKIHFDIENDDIDISTSDEDANIKSRDPSPSIQLTQQPKQLSNSSDQKKSNFLSSHRTSSSSEDDNNFLASIPQLKIQKKRKKKLLNTQEQEKSEDESVDDSSNDDMHKEYKRITKRKPSKVPTQISTVKKRKTLQRRPSVSKKRTSTQSTNAVTTNAVIEEKPFQQRKVDTADISFINSPSIDIDIDGDGSDSNKEDEEAKCSIMNRRKEEGEKHTTTTHQELDDEVLEKILQDLDEPDKEEKDWHEDEYTVSLNKEWDPFCQTKDVEDLDYLRAAIIEKVDPNVNALNTALAKLERNEMRMSQSARTRGYYPIPDSVKATYLPKNKAIFEPAAITHTNGRATTNSRSNRVNKRRLVVGMVMQNKAMADTDIIKYNQLQGRKKRLRFSKSPIHDWGLYAEERIHANDLVIEYIGEVIRQQVAEERERQYERCGIGSSYLFRIDEDTVIDATKKGSIARFINHCCSPNCSAKIITIDKQKKIVIYANRDIEPGEEITYDYKFPIETDKIPCLCGSKFCKGTLN